ncbi:MAG: hypothetical protein FJ253_10225, partial [Phycisphaerae bacterium]|nr:hypothetical protein [Phycisphaerae bacterium]
MSDSPFLVGLLNLLLVALLGALVWLVAWALFGDRDWKRPRCPRCHHDLRGSTGLQCPECGFTARSTRELHRRRRRWMVAIAALVALFSLAVLLRSVWSRTSWTSAVPNRVALWLLPRTGSADTGDDLADALGDRLARGELSDGEIEDLLALLLEGDSRAPIGSIAWVGKYGPLVDRWMNVGRRHFLEAAPTPERQAISDAFDRGLERLPPTVGTALPTRWLAGEPLAFELLVERRWNYALPMRVVVESLEFERATAAVRPPVVGPIVLAHGRPVPARIPLLFDPLPAGAHRGTLRVSIETGGESWTPLASVELPVHVPVAEALEGPFDPFHDEALDAAVRDCLTPGLIRWARGSRRFAMRLNPTQELRDRLGDVSLGVEAEIL